MSAWLEPLDLKIAFRRGQNCFAGLVDLPEPPNVERQQEHVQGKDRDDVPDDPVSDEGNVARDGNLTQPSARAHKECREDECGREVAETQDDIFEFHDKLLRV